MTIPIRPGPWSFLQTLGQGIGSTAAAAADYEKQDRAEASQLLKFLFDAASGPDKTIKAEALVGPTAQALMKRAGLGELIQGNLMAQPGEQLAEGQSQILGQLIPQVLQGGDQYAKERLAQGQIATTPETAKAREDTGRANIRAGVLEGGGAAARRVAEVPSETTAVAAESAATDPFYSNVGLRSVDATMTALKATEIDNSNIAGISDQAWQLAQQDARSRGFTLNEELTKPYIDAAIQQRAREQEERKAKMIAAQNRGGTDTAPQLIRLYQNQQSKIREALQALPKPDGTQKALAMAIEGMATKSKRTVQQVLDDPATPAISKSAYVAVKTYEQQVAAMQAELSNIGDNVTQLLGGMTGVPDPSALPAPTERRGGTGPAFNSPPPPDALGNQLKQRKSARYKALVAEEMKKPANKRRTQQEIMAQVDKEITAPTGGAGGRF